MVCEHAGPLPHSGCRCVQGGGMQPTAPSPGKKPLLLLLYFLQAVLGVQHERLCVLSYLSRLGFTVRRWVWFFWRGAGVRRA